MFYILIVLQICAICVGMYSNYSGQLQCDGAFRLNVNFCPALLVHTRPPECFFSLCLFAASSQCQPCTHQPCFQNVSMCVCVQLRLCLISPGTQFSLVFPFRFPSFCSCKKNLNSVRKLRYFHHVQTHILCLCCGHEFASSCIFQLTFYLLCVLLNIQVSCINI